MDTLTQRHSARAKPGSHGMRMASRLLLQALGQNCDLAVRPPNVSEYCQPQLR
jgi:hypothetical protein